MSADEQIPSVWTRPRREREQPALSRQQIVSEAVRLLDEEGIEALSMRRLGTRLGAGATSLYRHVANKNELIELVVDRVYGEIELPDAGDQNGWRAAATRWAHSLRGAILRHPWMVSVLGEVGLSYLGPNMMRQSEEVLGLFETAGFTLSQANHCLNTVVAYTVGHSTGEAAFLTTIARSGQTDREWTRRLWPAARQAAQPYPRLRQLYSEPPDGTGIQEKDFDIRLERVLDGLEVWLANRHQS